MRWIADYSKEKFSNLEVSELMHRETTEKKNEWKLIDLWDNISWFHVIFFFLPQKEKGSRKKNWKKIMDENFPNWQKL